MHVVGGLYLELCSVPSWRGAFGSGGRAAASIANREQRPVVLHTYSDEKTLAEAGYLQHLKIDARVSPRPHGIAFAYFHALSKPHVEPQPPDLVQLPQLVAEGEAVLRFGFVEGSALVRASRAVYDPQTWRNPQPFGSNGSKSDELAIVLNELELRALTGEENLFAAAAVLFDRDNATVVVAKRGIAGATVMQRGCAPISIPAYRSNRVFKIGTGDVFSGMFARYWADERRPVAEAADLASRSVAAYCESPTLPIAINKLDSRAPLNANIGVVKLVGSVSTIGRRYTMEEARYVLSELGVSASCPALESNQSLNPTATLILADGFEHELDAELDRAKKSDLAVVMLREDAAASPNSSLHSSAVQVTDDFCTAMYWAAWASAR